MRSKAEDIAMVLRLLGEGRFEYHTFGGGTALVFKGYEPSLTELEDFFAVELGPALDDDENPGEHWDDGETATLIDRFFYDTNQRTVAESEQLKQQLRGKSYQEVLSAVYRKWWEFQDTSYWGRRLLDGREELAEPLLAEADDAVALYNSEALTEWLARGIASRLGALYPKMLRRAEKLRVLPAVRQFPEKVQPYLKEATRCYLFGQFLAGAVLCRAIVEFALQDFLVQVGRERDLRSVEMRDGDGLLALISLVRLVAGRERGAILDHADEIRRRVNRALHQEPLDDQTCMDLFIKTRGVLKQLYA